MKKKLKKGEAWPKGAVAVERGSDENGPFVIVEVADGKANSSVGREVSQPKPRVSGTGTANKK